MRVQINAEDRHPKATTFVALSKITCHSVPEGKAVSALATAWAISLIKTTTLMKPILQCGLERLPLLRRLVQALLPFVNADSDSHRLCVFTQLCLVSPIRLPTDSSLLDRTIDVLCVGCNQYYFGGYNQYYFGMASTALSFFPVHLSC